MSVIAVITVMTMATFPIRALSLLLFSNLKLAPITLKFLSLVPIAVLSAICSPLILLPSGQWKNPATLIEVWATLGAIFFARYGTLPSITVGIGIYLVGKRLIV